jgi:hypothetical protein
MMGSMAERRRSSRLMTPNTPRFWPEMKARRGFCASWPRYPLSTLARSIGQPVSVSVRSISLDRRLLVCFAPAAKIQHRNPNGLGLQRVNTARDAIVAEGGAQNFVLPHNRTDQAFETRYIYFVRMPPEGHHFISCTVGFESLQHQSRVWKDDSGKAPSRGRAALGLSDGFRGQKIDKFGLVLDDRLPQLLGQLAGRCGPAQPALGSGETDTK